MSCPLAEVQETACGRPEALWREEASDAEFNSENTSSEEHHFVDTRADARLLSRGRILQLPYELLSLSGFTAHGDAADRCGHSGGAGSGDRSSFLYMVGVESHRAARRGIDR